MWRMSILVLLFLAIPARAETFGGWQYTDPPGYTTRVGDERVTFTKQMGATFCLIDLFAARAVEDSVAKETANEWNNIVTHSFSAKVLKRATVETKQGVTISATTARLDDEYMAVHYVVMPPGMIGSVLLTSTSPAALAGCRKVADAFVSTLAIDWTSPRFTDPEARVETPIGRWAFDGREYTFMADGRYHFRSRRIDETGTYAWVGNQLTLTPSKNARDKATYTWGRSYLPDTGEWQLVLTPRKATRREPKPSTFRFSEQMTTPPGV